MNNFKKIGLTALAGSLVATSAFAGSMSVSGSASINLEHTNGGAANTGKTFSMGNQLTFSGSGELDNGLNVSLSFILDQNDDSTTAASNLYSGGPFDSHSVTVSSDSLGSLKFSGEGGSSSTTAIDTSAAGDLWDNYDAEDGLEPNGVGDSDNMLMYTLPTIMEGVSINASYEPKGSGTQSAVGYGLTYTGVEGLSVSYATGDDSTITAADATVLKASYAYGPVTVAYSDYEYDTSGTSSDDDMTAYKVTYTVSDELSVSYADEEIDTGTTSASYDEVSVAYTTGGMTISASMGNAKDRDGTTTVTMDNERWAVGASFAF